MAKAVSIRADVAHQSQKAVLLPGRQQKAQQLMKILDTPRTGALGQTVAFQSRFGLCLRERVCPRNNRTPACEFMRGAFGHHSRVYSHKLSAEQLDRWRLAGAQVMSDPRLGQSGPLTGQQLYTSINSVRSRVDLPETLELPARVSFSAQSRRQRSSRTPSSARAFRWRSPASCRGPVMVFGQAPCSSGRHKRRNLAYLGLLPLPVNGLSDITDLYRARYGEPRPGTKVFIVTCQQKDGWKAFDQETSAIVPDRPNAQQATAEPPASQYMLMHKGSSRDAEAMATPPVGQLPVTSRPGTGDGNAAVAGSEGSVVPGEEGDAPGEGARQRQTDRKDSASARRREVPAHGLDSLGIW